MNSQPEIDTHERLTQLAAAFPYPQTPDFVGREQARLQRNRQGQSLVRLGAEWRPLWVTLLLLAFLTAGLLAVPAVRAAIVTWLEIGSVRIWLGEEPSTPPAVQPPTVEVTTTMQPLREVVPTEPKGGAVQANATTTVLSTLLDFSGETTLEAAQASVDFPILLPTVPTELGAPDRVFLQRAEGDAVILVWLAQGEPDNVRMSLHLLGPGAFIYKMQPPSLAAVEVNGNRAIWTDGPYFLQAGDGWGNRRLVDGHVLIWAEGTMTYRLESTLDPNAAVAVAESLQEYWQVQE